MSNISADVRLRPIRFGFLVRPDDAGRVADICRINTCLWGGQFNPIIPHLSKVPPWWEKHGFQFETATEIVSGYLDFFEPDFLVEAERGLADGLGFDSKRILPLLDLLPQEEGRSGREGHGQTVFSLYGHLYRKEFQFARRHEHNIVDVTADAPFAGAAACLFGAFPEDEPLQYLRQAFVDAFEPKAVALNGPQLAQLYETGYTSALRLGYSGIAIDPHGWHDPALFVFDADRSEDLVDFWNLRAVRRHVLPVPLQWLPALSQFCRNEIVRTFRPLPGNPHGVMIRVTVMFARSIPKETIENAYAEYLRVDVSGANVKQDWYPALWQRRSSGVPHEMRPTLSAARKSFNAQSPTGATEVQFDCLHPEFSEEFGGQHRWANVIRLRDWSFDDVAATVFPCDYRKPFLPRFRIGGQHTLPTTEGITIFPRFKNIPERWELPEGSTAIEEWLKHEGVDAAPSDAGRATQQIVQTLGGFIHVGDLASGEVISTLNDMSRRPVTRSLHHLAFRNRIRNAMGTDIWQHRGFETLVERKAVELGLELRCTKCSTWSWFALSELAYKMTCGLCLREFAFPITNPGASVSARWSYRVIGAFALPDYARGGYAAALAMRVFSEILGDREAGITWSAGKNLTLTPDRNVEVDFILWYQRRALIGQDQDTDLVFGEAKSFGKDVFDRKGVRNMRKVAEHFPGAVLVFATMKQPDELSPAEIECISTVAVWGRKYLRNHMRTRAPVILLTGIELFASVSLTEAWKQAGGKHAAAAEAARYRTNNLRVIADLTQQLYLNLPPYSSWLDARWNRFRARRQKREQALKGTRPAGTEAAHTGE